MKKIFALLLAFVMVLGLAACGETAPAATPEPTVEPTVEPTPEATEEPAPALSLMSYADFAAAELDSPVMVETYVQAKQSWWDNKATFYTQNEDGAYFIYNMPCTEEEYETLVPGTKLIVTGYKSAWAGEVEITDASFEIVESDPYLAEAKDVTAALGTDALIESQNRLVAFKGLTVEAYDEEGSAFAYKNAENKTDDLYFKASKDGATYDFCVEYYLCNEETEVYKAVEALNVGDVVDLEGFLYWYEGPNPHITAVSVAEAAPAAPAVMSYADFAAAEVDTYVSIETYVQAKQSWWDNKATLYTQDQDGAYFIYNAPCTEEEYALLVPGTKIAVQGYKAEWAGEVEIVDASIEILADAEPYIAEAKDITALWGTEDMKDYMNQLVAFKGVCIDAYDESGAAFAYKNAENKTDDLYFKVLYGDTTYEFTVEYYLCNEETEVYKAVEGLTVGDFVDLEGFLYWYEGPNPHITSVTVTQPAPVMMTYAEYAAAEMDSLVVVDTYVQAKQSWWDGKATFYTQDQDGAYFLYNMPCTEEEYEALVPGTEILVTGYKSAWAGEVEIVDAVFAVTGGEPYIAEAKDVTALLGTDALIESQNQFVSFKGMRVKAYDESGAAFAYKNAENKTDDLYFKVAKDGVTYDFCVEYYLCNEETEVYKAVEGLNVGDLVDLEGFLYWYEGANPHITSLTVVEPGIASRIRRTPLEH